MRVMTEAEARKHTCPFMTYCANERAVVEGTSGAIHYQALCVASECMKWEFAPSKTRIMVTPPGKPEEEWSWNPQDERYDRRIRVTYKNHEVRIVTDTPKGFCSR